MEDLLIFLLSTIVILICVSRSVRSHQNIESPEAQLICSNSSPVISTEPRSQDGNHRPVKERGVLPADEWDEDVLDVLQRVRRSPWGGPGRYLKMEGKTSSKFGGNIGSGILGLGFAFFAGLFHSKHNQFKKYDSGASPDMSALMPLLIAQGGTGSPPQGPYPQMAPGQEDPVQIPYPYPYPYQDPGQQNQDPGQQEPQQYDQLDEMGPAQGGEEQTRGRPGQMEGGTGQMQRGPRQMQEQDKEQQEQNNSETEITYNK